MKPGIGMKITVATWFIYIAMITLLAFTSFGDEIDSSNKPISINISDTNLTLVRKQPKYTLDYEVLPSGTSQDVVWSSSNEKVATVSSKGVITTRKTGSATIKCTSKRNSNVSAQCYLTVTEADVKLEGVEVTKEEYNVVIGKRVKLQYNMDPANASNKYIKWKIEDKGICSVTDAGYVYGIKEGDTTIIGTTDDGGFDMEFYISVSESNDATYESFEEDYPGLEISSQQGVDEGVWLLLASGQYLFYDNYNGKFTSGWFNQGNNMYITVDTPIEVEVDNENYNSDTEGSEETIKKSYTLPVLQQNTWYAGPNSWSFLDGSGALVKSNWINYGSRWYYVNSAGEMKTGKFSVGTDTYVTDENGACQVGFIKFDNQLFYADPTSCKCTKGWVQVADKWYFGNERTANLETDMYIATEDPKMWYYVQKDGTMLVNGTTPDGKSADASGLIRK